jgi:WD40 repeat protein
VGRQSSQSGQKSDERDHKLAAREVRSFDKVEGQPKFISITPDDLVIACSRVVKPEGQDVIACWDCKTGMEKWTTRQTTSEFAVLYALSPDGKTLAKANAQGIWVLKTTNGKELVADSSVAPATGITFSADARKLAVLGLRRPGNPENPQIAPESGFQVWNYGDEGDLRRGVFLKNPFRASPLADLTKDFKSGVTNSGNVDLWVNVDFDNKATRLKRQAGRVNQALFSPCGKWLVTRSSGKDDEARTVRIWDAKNGAEVKKLEYSNFVNCLTISADGKWLATGIHTDKKGEVVIWEIPSGKKLLTIEVKESVVCSLAFSAKGNRLAAITGGAGNLGEAIRAGGSWYVWEISEAKAEEKKGK